MYSAYLFLAFIFGRAFIAQSAVTLEQDMSATTKTSIVFVIKDDSVPGGDTLTYNIQSATNAAGDDAAGVAGKGAAALGVVTIGTGVVAGTKYWYKATRSDVEGPASDWTEMSTLTALADVAFDKADSTTATFKWTNFGDYSAQSVKVNGEAGTAPTKEEVVVENLKPATLNKIEFTGEISPVYYGTDEIKVCTAPSKPTITKKIESTTATTPVNTLTLTIKFADGEKVSSLDFETGVDLTQNPTCAKCTDALTLDGTKKFTATPTKDENEVVVVLGAYPEANAETDIQVVAKFDDGGTCTPNVGQITTTMNSVATLANKEAMLVYLVIGTMASVLRLLGMEVWTPIGLL